MRLAWGGAEGGGEGTRLCVFMVNTVPELVWN